MSKFVRFIKDESGATAIEYGLIAAATGLVLVAISPALSAALQALFIAITGGLAGSVA